MQNYFDNEATSSSVHATMKPARGGKCLVTFSTYEDRQEALMNTTILDDAGTCRSKGPRHNVKQMTQNIDTVDHRQSQLDTCGTHIPEPPPPQMVNNNYKAKTAQPNSPPTTKSYANEQHNGYRLSNGSQSNEVLFSRTSKIPSNTNTNVNHNSSPNINNNAAAQTNRHTLRLGTVTIGEYRNNTLRREPEKFDFIGTQKRGKDSGDTTPTNEGLQSELQNTLSRSNLRKSNGNSYLEHQRNCPLAQQQQLQPSRQSEDYSHNGYTVEEIAKKLQKTSINDKNTTELLTKTNNRPLSTNNVGAAGVGILKNGNRNSANSNYKSTEKSIKFG